MAFLITGSKASLTSINARFYKFKSAAVYNQEFNNFSEEFNAVVIITSFIMLVKILLHLCGSFKLGGELEFRSVALALYVCFSSFESWFHNCPS